MQIEPGELAQVLLIFGESEMRELRLELGDLRLHVSKDGAVGVEAAPTAAGLSRTTAASMTSSASTLPGQTTPSVATNAPASGAGAVEPTSVETLQAEKKDGATAVLAPTVGVFYRRPGPGEPPYVEVGERVNPATVVGTVEVMKMFTEIRAGCCGRIVSFEARNEEFVEYGQVVAYVDSEQS